MVSDTPPPVDPLPDGLAFLGGGGRATALILEQDWSRHPLGPPHGWPEALKTALSLILNSPESMILAWGRTDLVFFFNETYIPLLGPRVATSMGAPFKTVWADAWEQAMPIIEDAFAGRSQHFDDLPWKLDTDRGPADTWWTFSYSRILDAAGEVAGLFIFTNETTDQVLSNAALQASEESLRLVVEGARDYAIITTDPAGRITTWSTGAEIITGWRAGEVVGQPISLFFTPEDRANGEDARELLRAKREGYANDERWHMTKSGSRVFMNGSVHPLPPDAQGAERGFIKVARDETERWRAGEALRASEAVARENIQRVQLALSAGAIIGTWFWDLPTDRFTIDEAFANAFGIDPALGREGLSLAQVVATVHPEDQAGLAAAIDEAIERGGAYAHPYRVRRADGRYYWIEANGRVDYAADGTPLSFPGVLLDIEERRAVESERDRVAAELRALNETLEQRVAERTAELMRTEELLRQSQKLEAVGQLTGGVAHDFNNLLTIIRSSTDFLKRDDLPAARRVRYVEAISDTVERASKLTSQLLAFARRQPLTPQVFDVSARVRDVSDLIRPLVGVRIAITVDPCEPACFTEADASQFETALVNLAVNARDAMDGEGRLAFSVKEVKAVPAIRGHVGATGDFIAVSVADSGRGIAPDQMARIFEPFYTTKEVGKGTGLGLSQVFGFTKQSGGEVDVSSQEGQGAVFTLYLPSVPGASTGCKGEALITHAMGPKGLNVLVVEDNEAVGRFADEMLRDLGYETRLVGNAGEALAAVEAEDASFDVVFSDVIMPGMNGVELAREIRRRRPDLPVVLTSGYSNVLAQEGAHGFELLCKPYSIEALSRILSTMVKLDASAAPQGPQEAAVTEAMSAPHCSADRPRGALHPGQRPSEGG